MSSTDPDLSVILIVGDYLAGYAPWIPPAERGESELVASHNSSYRREVLLAYGERLDGLLELSRHQ
jgi:hypothetical protein